MLCYVFLMVSAIILSEYDKCVITITSHHKFSFFFHLAIFPENISTRKTPSARPRLSCTTQYQLLVALFCFLQLHSAWGCPPRQLHCAILEVSRLSIDQNCAEVVSKPVPICTSHEINYQASLWSTENMHCTVTQGCNVLHIIFSRLPHSLWHAPKFLKHNHHVVYSSIYLTQILPEIMIGKCLELPLKEMALKT